MPTIANHPTLRSTQAVGAILMHQFARERFIEAGINADLIQKAEEQEDVNQIVSDLIQNDGSILESSDETSTLHLNSTSSTNQNSTFLLNNRSEGDQFHSIIDSPSCTNKTFYHSLNEDTEFNINRLESLPSMRYYGQQLRQLAEEFEKDRKRKIVKENADKVNLGDITRENFMKLLEELFQDRVTREKIVVLFFFCTDVALRAADFTKDLVIKLMGWSFSYIINTVCKFVYELGGWDSILFKQLPSITMTCCAVLGIIALIVYIRKNLKG